MKSLSTEQLFVDFFAKFFFIRIRFKVNKQCFCCKDTIIISNLQVNGLKKGRKGIKNFCACGPLLRQRRYVIES